MTNDYTTSAERASKTLTRTFSSSFSSAITLFDASIQQDIYNIYGLVRIADEIVDTYQGHDAGVLLDELEIEVYNAIKRGFSANIIVQAFIETARSFGISQDLIAPFFTSMRMDLEPVIYDQKTYEQYIYGSAEVVGLMCLRVFVAGDQNAYEQLVAGARALGAAFQKVNFLRDIKDDYDSRGRYYFPYGSYQHFDDATKNRIIADIEQDFTVAEAYIKQLPTSARSATRLAYDYYWALLKELSVHSAAEIAAKRFSVKKQVKMKLLLKAKAGLGAH